MFHSPEGRWIHNREMKSIPAVREAGIKKKGRYGATAKGRNACKLKNGRQQESKCRKGLNLWSSWGSYFRSHQSRDHLDRCIYQQQMFLPVSTSYIVGRCRWSTRSLADDCSLVVQIAGMRRALKHLHMNLNSSKLTYVGHSFRSVISPV